MGTTAYGEDALAKRPSASATAMSDTVHKIGFDGCSRAVPYPAKPKGRIASDPTDGW